jgi:hypothetical protein
MGMEPNIPVNPRNGGKPKPCSLGIHGKMGIAVERFFGWVENFKRIINDEM